MRNLWDKEVFVNIFEVFINIFKEWKEDMFKLLKENKVLMNEKI